MNDEDIKTNLSIRSLLSLFILV